MNANFIKDSWKYLILILIISIPLFHHLGSLPIQLWDEARLANNAYEMYRSGNYLVTTFEGQPDMWNTKPPLMIWLQVLCMKIFGVNEWAIRLPSAFAALFTCILLILISTHYLRSYWFAFICVLILITSRGFVGLHTARTGDYDTVLTLFLTLAGLSLFVFIENAKTKYLYLFFLAMTLAVLTKSAAALMVLPGVFIYVIIKKKLLSLLKNKHLYFGLLFFLTCSFGFYLFREMHNTGYINAVMVNEFGGRFLETLENHRRGFLFYFNLLFSYRFVYWTLFLPFGIYIGCTNKYLKISSLTIFSSIMVLIFYLVTSFAQTKLPWYVMPMYPFLAILVAVCIYHIFIKIKERKNLKYKAIPYIFLGLIFIFPYSQMVYKTCYEAGIIQTEEETYAVANCLRDMLHKKNDNDNFAIVFDGYHADITFYLRQLQEQGKNISLKNINDIKIGEIVFISQDSVKQYVEDNYEFTIIEKYNNSVFYNIVSHR